MGAQDQPSLLCSEPLPCLFTIFLLLVSVSNWESSASEPESDSDELLSETLPSSDEDSEPPFLSCCGFFFFAFFPSSSSSLGLLGKERVSGTQERLKTSCPAQRLLPGGASLG